MAHFYTLPLCHLRSHFFLDQPCKHMNISQYLMTNVLSLKEFTEPTPKEGISILKAISLAMVLLQRCEFKLNHEAWFNTVKHRIGVRNSSQVLAVVNATQDNIKSLYKVRAEMRSALNSHLKCLFRYFEGE
ncbi:outer envelope protein 64, mitochondrial-like isoform X3 [Zingiber officinale]|uniref:outer envelope protein 64, mitochondrial-like isoform X3 n=1 Tax=Zingiber officinale TaxID=94328 RepID=UPI001C4C19CC|nr:outer envelope protein 64, mitochondrial-like isoform X3 [Zingiber officinale]